MPYNAIAAFYAADKQNQAIGQQLQAQSTENAKTRAYNLRLAQMQNNWNIAQWNRENAYNTPSAQKARLSAAGLNADMMYGNGGVSNTSASSPAMTAGDGATPMDWTALGSKRNYGDAMMQMLQAQALQASIKKTKADTKGTEIDNLYKNVEKELGIKLSNQAIKANEKEFEILLERLEQSKVQTKIMGEDLRIKEIDNAYKAEIFQSTLDNLAADLKIKNKTLEEMTKALAYKLSGLELDAKLKEAELKWNDPSILERLGGNGSAALLKILMMIFK